MAFQLSPGVNFSEIDLTNATAAVGTTEGAIAGVFRWGPVNERTLITSENQLVDVFGLPNTRYTDANYVDTWSNAETFTTAANFLGYSDALYVVRVTSDSAASADIKDSGNTNTLFEGKYEGALGNSIEVSWCKGTGTSNVGFTGVELGNAQLTLADATTGQITGIQTQAEANKIEVGSRIKLSDSIDQELVIASVTVGGDGSTSNTVTFNPDTVPAISTVSAAAPTSIAFANSVGTVTKTSHGLNNGDIIILSGTNTGNGSITGYDAVNGNMFKVANKTNNTYELKDLDDTDIAGGTDGTLTGVTVKKVTASGVDESFEGIVTGAVIPYEAGAVIQYQSGNVTPLTTANGELLVDGTVFYAIPCSPLTGVPVAKSIAFKIATSQPNALAGTAIELNKIFDQSSSETSSFSQFEDFTVDFTLESRFTGVALPSVQNFKVKWGDSDKFDAQPTENNYHIVVKDADGSITGTTGGIIESYEDVSVNPIAKKLDGSANFIPDVLENTSTWIKLQTSNIGKFTNVGEQSSGTVMTGGDDGQDEKNAAMLGKLALGYDLFSDASEVDISFVLQGRPVGANGYELANYIIDNVAEARRDCVAFISPPKTLTSATDIVDSFSNFVTRSSYAVLDSGYKYQYDKYADVYRYVPLNGDIAGLCARTDDLRDPWFSPAGINRGNVKNVVKLNVNPNKAQRDLLYKNGVNPVITQPGQGTILFGDKTFQGKASAFDRINVRRLFIVLEKTIANAAKSSLFEFNDEFTRAQFVNLVEPFLRDVQGRRGIYDFKVVCDDSNNTGQVIDTNSFVGDIYVKPARSINFIQLNFVAVRTGVEFSEVVGAA